jgi:hypothetical protein
LPQACDDSPALARLKRHHKSSLDRRPVRISNDGFNRDVLHAVTLLTLPSNSERLDDAFGSRIESDGGVLSDEGAVEGPGGHEESEQRLLFGGRRRARNDCEGPTA